MVKIPGSWELPAHPPDQGGHQRHDSRQEQPGREPDEVIFVGVQVEFPEAEYLGTDGNQGEVADQEVDRIQDQVGTSALFIGTVGEEVRIAENDDVGDLGRLRWGGRDLGADLSDGLHSEGGDERTGLIGRGRG